MVKLYVGNLFIAAILSIAGFFGCRNVSASVALPVPVAVTAGAYHTCVLWNSGGVSCWGNNEYGQLGNASAGKKSSSMVSVAGLQARAKQLVAGDWFTCALLTTGAVSCWGNNGLGQLGITPGGAYLAPSEVPGFNSNHPIVQLAAGGDHVCARDSASRVYCWGSNLNLQLGYTPNGFTSQPQLVSLPASAISITAGETMTCALTSTLLSGYNNIYCWGNMGGGIDSWGQNNSSPILVSSNLANFFPVAISAGMTTVCAFGTSSTGGVPACFGGNDQGQLGAGLAAYDDSYDLSPVSPESGSVALLNINVLATGPARDVNCANALNKGVYCWGRNDYGQVGDDKKELIADKAQLIFGNPWSAISIAAGDRHTCAVLAYANYSNTIFCWGYNQDGELGDGTIVEKNTPVEIW